MLFTVFLAAFARSEITLTPQSADCAFADVSDELDFTIEEQKMARCESISEHQHICIK